MNVNPFGVLLVSSILVSGALYAQDRSVVKLDTDVFPYALSIDGKATLPHIFFYNTDKMQFDYLGPQVEMAARAGVHIYSFPYYAPLKHPTDEPDFSGADAKLERFVALDPKAQFLLRLVLGPNHTWKAFNEETGSPEGEYAEYADGSKSGLISFGSRGLHEPTTIQLRKVVRHLEQKYPGRVLVYHVGVPASEFFDLWYREKGPDYSRANTDAFRRYLKEYYEDVDALREAWGDEDLDFDSAQIPRPEPGRFPMHNVTDRRISAFYKPVVERDWIDYSEFCSELMSDHLIRWCRVVKEETQGEKLTAAFYGYLFTLPGSFAGHFNLAKVLNSEYVDILCSPVSYSDRGVGSAGTFMSPVDSVILHKKLWVNEDDTRTHAIDVKAHGQKPGFGATTNVNETLGVIDRNMANVLSRGAGIWWMDLGASGMYNDQAIWDLVEKRQSFFRGSRTTQKSYSAEVQLIVDERSKMYIADDHGVDRNIVHNIHTALNSTSVPVDTFLFSDYVEGNTPRADLVVFANTFVMSPSERVAVQERLDRDGSHRVWCYLPGYIDDTGTYDAANVAELTGFDVKLVPGKIDSSGTRRAFKNVGFLGYLGWMALDLDLEERPVVSGKGCEIIGEYNADGLPCAAMKSSNGVHSFFFGSPGLGVECFRAVFEMTSVHLWTQEPAVVTRNNRYLSVYTGKAGPVLLNVPKGITLKTPEGTVVPAENNAVSLHMDKTGMKWFVYE